MILYVWPSLDCGRGEDALRAAQLCLQLLESTNRDESRRLLGFMAAAADNEAFRLHKQVNESSVYKQTHVYFLLKKMDIYYPFDKKDHIYYIQD